MMKKHRDRLKPYIYIYINAKQAFLSPKNRLKKNRFWTWKELFLNMFLRLKKACVAYICMVLNDFDFFWTINSCQKVVTNDLQMTTCWSFFKAFLRVLKSSFWKSFWASFWGCFWSCFWDSKKLILRIYVCF